VANKLLIGFVGHFDVFGVRWGCLNRRRILILGELLLEGVSSVFFHFSKLFSLKSNLKKLPISIRNHKGLTSKTHIFECEFEWLNFQFFQLI